MGNDPVNTEEIAEQERGIEILKNLPPEAKMYLCHHLRNALAPAINVVELHIMEGTPIPIKQAEVIRKGIDHAIADLRRIGC